MVVQLLYLSLELENIAQVSLPEAFVYCLDVKNPSGEEYRRRVTMNAIDSEPIPNSRGNANFLVRWEGSKHFANMKVFQVKGVTRPIVAAESGQFVPVVAFEGRGVECVGFEFGGGFEVQTAGGGRLRDVDLRDDWADFDEEKGVSVSILNPKWKFEVHK
eukprot:GHVT01068086.1.p1 GENE.GHVT01068086.1~~GHVT01068086.1.p1  ORF type:complete len:160 (+),score=26.63 GHVT01068086.1:331-810(+)